MKHDGRLKLSAKVGAIPVGMTPINTREDAMPANEAATGKFLCLIDPSATDLASAASAFEAKGVTVVERMDIIDTLVLAGDSGTIRKAAAEIKGVRSLEAEGTVRTQD